MVPPISASQQMLHVQRSESDARTSSLTLHCAPHYSPARIPDGSLPIRGDIRSFDVDKLMAAVGNFQAVVCNFPWTARDAPSAGSLEEMPEPLSDADFLGLPITTLQQHGYLFLWVPMTKVALAIEALEEAWGYTIVGNLTWIKLNLLTLYGRKETADKNQRAKETCLVARKGAVSQALRCYGDVLTTTDIAATNKKPEQLYKIAEAAAGCGHCLEMFATAHGLRDG